VTGGWGKLRNAEHYNLYLLLNIIQILINSLSNVLFQESITYL
jgi:hypothetical protein